VFVIDVLMCLDWTRVTTMVEREPCWLDEVGALVGLVARADTGSWEPG
jgi:hypothetical protein